MTDLEIYDPPAGQLEQYPAMLTMTPEQAKALDDQVRRCTEAVLREGTDYGVIPGTGGEKSLWRPGAQKLLQWFGLSFSCERVEVERDDQGRKHGITYRCTVARRLPDGSLDVKATCEGTADYDESKFYQSAEARQRKAEDDERRFAHKDKRPPRPTKWQGLPEYRADWNALMKRAQKRAIVGAVVDATAAGGIFSEREEDDRTPAAQDDGPTWYEKALEDALTFTDQEDGRKMYVRAAQAARDGLCTPRQATHIQNRIQQRVRQLKTVTTVDVEDLGRQAAAHEDPVPAVPDEQAPSGPAAGAEPGELIEEQPGTVSKAQLTKLHAQLTKLGFSSDEREQKLAVAEAITGRKPLTGPHEGRSSKNLSWAEAAKLTLALAVLDSRDDLVAWMAGREQDGSDA